MIGMIDVVILFISWQLLKHLGEIGASQNDRDAFGIYEGLLPQIGTTGNHRGHRAASQVEDEQRDQPFHRLTGGIGRAVLIMQRRGGSRPFDHIAHRMKRGSIIFVPSRQVQ